MTGDDAANPATSATSRPGSARRATSLWAWRGGPGSQLRLLLGATAGALAVLAGFAVLAAVENRPFSFFSREPAEILDVSRYIGWQAHVTVLVTALGVGAAGFAALVVRTLGGDRVGFRFLVGIALFTGLLLLDDFLQFHESVYPRFLGLSEQLVYPAYVATLVVIVWLWGRRAVADNLVIVLAAVLFLSISVLADLVLDSQTFANYHYVEDGSKMLGFTLWAVFLVRAGLQSVVTAVSADSPSEPSANRRRPDVAVLGRGESP